MTTKSKKSRRHQKLTLGRTRISRRARRIRRTFFDRQMELELALRSGDADAISKAKSRLASVEESFKSLPKLARKLEVSRAAAAAELESGEGEEE